LNMFGDSDPWRQLEAITGISRPGKPWPHANKRRR
jgi:hypothetical protein